MYFLQVLDMPALNLAGNGENCTNMSRTIALVLSSMIMICGSAVADEFYFVSPGTTTWNGVYVNPYQANDNTQALNNPLTVYCDDWNTDFSGNPTWNANVYALTAGNAAYFKYGNSVSNYNLTLSNHTLAYYTDTTPTAFTRYLEAAYLDQQWEAELVVERFCGASRRCGRRNWRRRHGRYSSIPATLPA